MRHVEWSETTVHALSGLERSYDAAAEKFHATTARKLVRQKQRPAGAGLSGGFRRSGRYSAGVGFFLNMPTRLSQSSILAPWRFMITPCCRIDSELFQAQ